MVSTAMYVHKTFGVTERLIMTAQFHISCLRATCGSSLLLNSQLQCRRKLREGTLPPKGVKFSSIFDDLFSGHSPARSPLWASLPRVNLTLHLHKAFTTTFTPVNSLPRSAPALVNCQQNKILLFSIRRFSLTN